MSVTEVNYPDPGFFKSTSLIQLGYGIWVHLTTVSMGLAFGFSAVTIPQLTCSESHITVTKSEQSWIVSSITLASPIGCLISGYCMDRYGRRTSLIFSHVPCSIGWLYTGLSKSVNHMIIGRVITGIGIGFIMTVPRVYTTEISLPNMRGVIGALPNIAFSMGVIAQAGMGFSCRWRTLCFICVLYEMSVLFVSYWLPETPYFVLKTSTVEEAEKTLKKFRSKKYNLKAEMNDMVEYKTQNAIHSLTFKEQIVRMISKSACKPFWIFVGYACIAQASGTTIMIMYTVDILQRVQSSVAPHTGNIILGITRLTSGVLTSMLMFKIGRRPLALVSSLGVGLICIIHGYLILKKVTQNTANSLIFFIAYIVFANLGYSSLPILIMYEMYPLQIRGFLGGVSISVLCLIIFTTNNCYPFVRDIIGYEYTIIGFGIMSLAGLIFLYFFLPETRGLTLPEIEEYYNELRPTLTSQRQLISSLNLPNVRSSSIASIQRAPRQPSLSRQT